MPATDWENEGVAIFKPEDLVRNDLAKKLEMLMPSVPKERVQALVDMVQNAKTPDFSWVPESARGPVMSESRKAAEAFDQIATAKVEADLKREERAKAIPKMKEADEAERQEIIATFRDQFAEEKQKAASEQAVLERLAQTFELPPEDQGRVSQRQIPTMIVKRKDLNK